MRGGQAVILEKDKPMILELEHNHIALQRARRVADRLFRPLPVRHGFYDPRGFAEDCQRNDLIRNKRKRVYWEIYRRVRQRLAKGITS